MGRSARLTALALAASACTACGATSLTPRARPGTRYADDASVLAVDLARTRPIGQGAAFRPVPGGNPAVGAGARVGPLRCRSSNSSSYGAHVELFAYDRGVQVPAGIGISGARRRGAFVVSGRCHYALSTVDPTGVVQVQHQTSSSTPTVGDLFALWGQPLSRNRLASFPGPVIAFIDGRRWAGDPRSIPLRRHAQIVLEVGPLVPPHPSYLFPPGL
jgi:hypothetical protein